MLDHTGPQVTEAMERETKDKEKLLYNSQDKQFAELEKISKVIKSNPIGKAQMLTPSCCLHFKVLGLKKYSRHNMKVYLTNLSPT